jgi:hypothetical protein
MISTKGVVPGSLDELMDILKNSTTADEGPCTCGDCKAEHKAEQAASDDSDDSQITMMNLEVGQVGEFMVPTSEDWFKFEIVGKTDRYVIVDLPDMYTEESDDHEYTSAFHISEVNELTIRPPNTGNASAELALFIRTFIQSADSNETRISPEDVAEIIHSGISDGMLSAYKSTL